MSSPLLNDNDIKGAKWILLNINSAEGDYECSMDELETINNILRARTGEHSDVIMGMGYDPTLGQKLGITLIATGFEHKDPFKKEEPKKAEQPVEEKIVMTLETEAPKAPEATAPEAPTAQLFSFDEVVETPSVNDTVEMEVEDFGSIAEIMLEAEDATVALDELQPTMYEYNEEVVEEEFVEEAIMEAPVSSVFVSVPEAEDITPEIELFATMDEAIEEEQEEVYELNMETTTVDYTTDFVLQKPSNIYEETSETSEIEESVEAEPTPSFTFEFDTVEATPELEVEETVVEAPVEATPEPVVFETSFRMVEQMEEEPSMQLVMKEVEPMNNARPAHQDFDMPVDNAEEQRRKVAERIQKLRNLSFNINNGADPNTEFDAVPAYVRRNLDLFGNTMASVENYYSKYTVEQDENNQTNISTINSFLDGKKPD